MAAALWDELAEFEAGKAEAARLHLMTRLSELLGAHNGGWIGGVRTAIDREDPLRGWRIGALSYLRNEPLDVEVLAEMKRRWERSEVDASSLVGVAEAGRFRAYTLRDSLPESWFAGDYYRLFYARRGVFDALHVGSPVTEDAESVFVFHRDEAAGVFGEDEIALAAYTLRPLKGWHRRWMLDRGLLVASKPLSPAERRVLGHLLSETLEKDIAAQLEISPTTAHDYVKSLYRKFGVRTRAGLMSLWLNRPAPSPEPAEEATPPE